MKKILTLLLFSISFLLLNNNVYAETNLYSGDVIIGNTIFTSDTWISAARASKAGALYAQNTGDAFVRTFIYINDNILYEMDSDTGEYYLIPTNEISYILDNLEIYYKNNNPIRMEYDFSLTDLTHDYISDYEITNITHEDVYFDSEREVFICPFGDAFEFNIKYEGPEGYTNEKYVAECGKNNELDLTLYELYATEPLNIDYIVAASTDTANNNQSKIIKLEYMDTVYHDDKNMHLLNIKTLGDLNSYNTNYNRNNKEWIGFKVDLGIDNIGYNYTVYSSGIDYYVEYFDEYLNIYIDSNNLKDYIYGGNEIIILDNKYNKQEYIQINYSNYNDDLSYEYVPNGEIEYISSLYKSPYDKDANYEYYPYSFGNNPIFYYNNKMYINKNLEYGSSFLFTDNGVLKSFESYTNSSNNEIVIQGIFDVHYYKNTKYNEQQYSSGSALSTNGLNNLYENVKRGYYKPQSGTIEIIEYFYDGNVPTEEQEKLDFLASKTDMFIVKDMSNVFYQN